MSLKKIKKLVKSPRQFFSDSKISYVKAAGNVFLATSEGKKVVTNLPKPTRAAPPRTSKAQPVQNLASFNSLYKPNTKRFWSWYQKKIVIEASVYIVPSVDQLVDDCIYGASQSLIGSTSFVPIWEFMDGLLDLADFNYRLRKNDVSAYNALNAIIGYIAVDLFGRRIIVSDDGSLFATALLNRLRMMGIECTNIKHFENGLSEESSHAQHTETVPSLEHYLSINADIHQESIIRKLFGLAADDELVFFYGALERFYQKEDSTLIEEINEALDNCLASLNEQSYLVIGISHKKKGYISEVLADKLSKIYRKRIIFCFDLEQCKLVMRAANRIFTTSKQHYDLIESILVHEPNEYWEKLSINEKADPSSVYCGLDGMELVRALRENQIHTIAVPDPLKNTAITEGRQLYLPTLLGVRERIYPANELSEAIRAELYVQWGAEPNEAKSRPEITRSLVNTRKLYLEDGFVRSIGLWTNVDEPTCSVVVDPDAIYYDATRPSLLEKTLNSDFVIRSEQKERALALISTIVGKKISKYNFAPCLKLEFSKKRKILIVDQKKGDMSIKYGLADEQSYWTMLNHALAQEDVEIFIKQHPCAISGNPEEAHFTRASLGEIANRENIHLIAFDVNPYSLFDAIDEVYVVTSGMGFEALMANKKVHCFGGAFYSNWGITVDHVNISRRYKTRSLEEIFFIFYIVLTFYVNPATGKRCELEELIDYIEQNRYVK